MSKNNKQEDKGKALPLVQMEIISAEVVKVGKVSCGRGAQLALPKESAEKLIADGVAMRIYN